VKHDVSRLPVIDGDRIIGIVDRHDVLKGLA
jgi:CBS domain-containing protein